MRVLSDRRPQEPQETGSPSALRRLNLAHVLRIIRAEGPMPRSAVAKSSRLSKPTVNEVAETLLGEGLLVESMASGDSDTSRRRPGPKARLLRFNSRRWLVAGVDVGAAKILAVLSDLDGKDLASARRQTPRGRGLDEVLQGIRLTVQAAVAKASASRESIAVVVVGTPGVVDPETGVVRFAPQLFDWGGRPLAQILQEALRTTVIVESETHLAVIGEHWRGVASGSRSVAYVQIGVGVGMGILIDGAVYPGAAGAAGEIGYLPIDGDKPDAEGLAGLGTFENAVGAPAFSRLARDAIAAGEGGAMLAAADGSEIDPVVVLDAAKAGDPAAVAIVDRIVATLGKGLTSVAAVLNPEMVVVGGGIATSLRPYVPRLQETLAASVPAPPRVEVSHLADQAVAIGALRRGIEHVESQVYDALRAGDRKSGLLGS